MAALPAIKIVELFYDVVSPYSWIAFETLCRYRTKWNIDLKFKPFYLAAIMQSSGNRPPGMVPKKGEYSLQDLHRCRQYYQIPLSPPSDIPKVMFEKGTLSAQRLITAIQMKRPDLTEAISRELWMRIYSRDEDITTPESFIEAGKKIGLTDAQVKEFLSSSSDAAVKDRLKQVTQEAIDYGAFGAPTIVFDDVNNEKKMIFGSDRMHIMAMLLGETYIGPLTELAQAKL